jgi:type II secretory pathway component PulF
MNTYAYRLLLPSGATRSGLLRLAVERDHSARLWLERNHDAVVLALYRMPAWAASLAGAIDRRTGRSLSSVQLSGLLRDLAVMTRAGVPLLEALRSVADETDPTQARAAAAAALLSADLDAGSSVSQMFARHPDLFPESVCNLMLIGEETGNVERMLLESAEHIERMTSLGRDVRQAMIYPAFVFATILGAALFWIYYVMPNLSELFTQMRVQLPPLTRFLLSASAWLEQHAVATLAVLLLACAASVIALRLHPGTRHMLYRLAHRLPIVRGLVTASGMAFITEHLSLLISAGIDIVRALGVLERSMSDEYYRVRIARTRHAVERGELLGPSMRAAGGFPPMTLRMVSVGEETGSLDVQLNHLAREYRQRLARIIGNLAEILKPLIILVAGGLFIVLVAALLLPIYDLVRQASMAPGG